MQTVETICSSCGAVFKPEQHEGKCKCPYCGKVYAVLQFDEDKKIELQIDMERARQAHEEEILKLRNEGRSKKMEMIVRILSVIFVIIIWVLFKLIPD